ncbi:formimidoylglutamate deiminase [Labrys okinawensis]|uniref:Formimidoylglutamate deiminase n=1 Tax=Labrys okinawensis TaxID=346911 RepID=A0A2S9Q9S9_9HYPH|nr:formimidoylglutamate deiminase [Labrys okinawensis]PRH86101.1 formimidoylglutamate deiminase [Labrys okinawensis]
MPDFRPQLQSNRSLLASQALLPDGWARNVLIEIDVSGRISAVTADASADGAEIASGPVLPAMPNLHSHAFQRAMSGLAEVSGAGSDSFWTWREEMYRTVGQITPEDAEAIATRLYVDLLKAGFGSIAEFHYLHHDKNGSLFADRAEMSKRILAAARTSGIGLTLLPVFYAHANFGGVAPHEGQRRFIHDVDGFERLMAELAPACATQGATLGYAFHSLRAATPEEMKTLMASLPKSGPLHIHIAEQQKEVDDSIAWSGKRPMQWLFDHMPVDERWCLIHATHADPSELQRMAASGAVAGLCPATEANLGDGIFDAVAYRARSGRFGIGTDSHVSPSVVDELRTLEYSQRLRDEKRNRLANGPHRSVGRDIYDAALAGGAQALGQPIGAIAPSMIASLVVLDGDDAFIDSAKDDAIVDRWLFALGDRTVRDVMVEGQWRIRDGRHDQDDIINAAFKTAIRNLARH